MGSVFITCLIPGKAAELLEAAGHSVTIRQSEESISHDELQTAAKQYDAILSMLTDRFDATLLSSCGPQLKIISNYAVGFDNIDIHAAQKQGIIVTNTPNTLNEAVAEYTVALMVALARRVLEADAFTRAGKFSGWRPLLFLGTELKGKTLGIVGLGRIGQGVARTAKNGFNMNIVYHDLRPDPEFEKITPSQFYSQLDDLLIQADIISLHVPLLPTTHHLINPTRLALMKKTALLINTARGAVVDEKALLLALKHGTIAGAALDVYEHEPALTAGLAELSNVIITPHIGSATHEAREAMSEIAAKNIAAVLAGEPALTPVTAV